MRLHLGHAAVWCCLWCWQVAVACALHHGAPMAPLFCEAGLSLKLSTARQLWCKTVTVLSGMLQLSNIIVAITAWAPFLYAGEMSSATTACSMGQGGGRTNRSSVIEPLNIANRIPALVQNGAKRPSGAF